MTYQKQSKPQFKKWEKPVYNQESVAFKNALARLVEDNNGWSYPSDTNSIQVIVGFISNFKQQSNSNVDLVVREAKEATIIEILLSRHARTREPGFTDTQVEQLLSKVKVGGKVQLRIQLSNGDLNYGHRSYPLTTHGIFNLTRVDEHNFKTTSKWAHEDYLTPYQVAMNDIASPGSKLRHLIPEGVGVKEFVKTILKSWNRI